MEISNKCRNISPSVTLAITAKAKSMKQEGIDVISFGAGEPDFDTPENIKNAAYDAIKSGFTKYTPASGILPLKRAICDKLKRDNSIEYETSQIVISNGAKQALYNSLIALCNPLDEVIVPKPCWVSYPELIKLVDAVPVYVNASERTGFKYDINDLKNVISNKTKAIILNSPNNPTGSVYTKEELNAISELAIENDLFIISDEIYEKLIYGNVKHISIASLNNKIKERTIVINGVSKAYAMTGWRIGYSAAPKEIAKVMSNVQSHVTSNPNSIAQYASLEALTGPQDTVENMRIEFQKRRNYMVETINNINGLSCKKPDGAFYVMVDIKKFKNSTLKNHEIKSSIDFCSALLEEEKVAAIPGAGFGDDDYIRLSYATSMDNIVHGLERIKNFVY